MCDRSSGISVCTLVFHPLEKAVQSLYEMHSCITKPAIAIESSRNSTTAIGLNTDPQLHHPLTSAQIHHSQQGSVPNASIGGCAVRARSAEVPASASTGGSAVSARSVEAVASVSTRSSHLREPPSSFAPSSSKDRAHLESGFTTRTVGG